MATQTKAEKAITLIANHFAKDESNATRRDLGERVLKVLAGGKDDKPADDDDDTATDGE